jgi:hypothetical protein
MKDLPPRGHDSDGRNRRDSGGFAGSQRTPELVGMGGDMPSQATTPEVPGKEAVSGDHHLYGPMARTYGYYHRPGEFLTGPKYKEITALRDTKTGVAALVGTLPPEVRSDVSSRKAVIAPHTFEPVVVFGISEELIEIGIDNIVVQDVSRTQIERVTSDGRVPLEEIEDPTGGIQAVSAEEMGSDLKEGLTKDRLQVLFGTPNDTTVAFGDNSSASDGVSSQEKTMADVQPVSQFGQTINSPEAWARQEQQVSILNVLRYVQNDFVTTPEEARAKAGLIDLLMSAALERGFTIEELQNHIRYRTRSQGPGEFSNIEFEYVQFVVNDHYSRTELNVFPGEQEHVNAYLQERIREGENGGVMYRTIDTKGVERVAEEVMEQVYIGKVTPFDAPLTDGR